MVCHRETANVILKVIFILQTFVAMPSLVSHPYFKAKDKTVKTDMK